MTRTPLKLEARLGLLAHAKTRAKDVRRAFAHRPEFFGRCFARYVHHVLRSASSWTLGEIELLATMVSETNRTTACLGAHRAMAERALGAAVVDAAIKDFRTAPIDEPLREAIAFIVKLSGAPKQVRPRDVDRLRKVGINDDAIRTLIHLCCILCTFDRIGDALGLEVPSASVLGRTLEDIEKP